MSQRPTRYTRPRSNCRPTLSAPKHGVGYHRVVGSRVAGWYTPRTPGQGTQPPESAFIRRAVTGGSARGCFKSTNNSETHGAWRHSLSALWLIPAMRHGISNRTLFSSPALLVRSCKGAVPEAGAPMAGSRSSQKRLVVVRFVDPVERFQDKFLG
jgi:hypothetical protein